MATVEIDGKKIEVANGKMIIEVADDNGIAIPRFCYHKKLSVAANCRMCLVEIENGRKPVPACATPITDGMKIFTKSAQAIEAQQAVMEFLLINHPLDCPICDQGGECELQDVSMGYGYDKSEYQEEKRVVEDENLGALIATDMTRCILCTRCVRFGEEIAGFRELGAIGRGEKTEISACIQKSMHSEVSANIIDLCPVGALTSKPFRFQARPWELTQYQGIAPHDCLGSHTYLHVRRNQLLRVVPKEKEEINETWLSDRDRFSYLGLQSPNRAKSPMIKEDGQWKKVDWPTALKVAAEGLTRVIQQHGPEQVAAFSSPSATVEEAYLLQKLLRTLGVENLDYRLQQSDFRDEHMLPLETSNSLLYADIEKQKEILILGCHLQREVPLAALRVRKAAKNGATIYAINPVEYDFPFAIEEQAIVAPQAMPTVLAQLLLAMTPDISKLPLPLQTLLQGLEVEERVQNIAKGLRKGHASIIIGALLENHPEASILRALVHALETFHGLSILQLTTGANARGMAIAGMLPHRKTFGVAVEPRGLSAKDAIENKLKAYLLHSVEPGLDFVNPYVARQSMLAAELVIMLSPYFEESMEDYVDVFLPIAPFAETSGTYVNVDGLWQSFQGVCAPYEEARPAWKVFRVLGNLLHCPHFDYTSSEEVIKEIKALREQAIVAPPLFSYPDKLPEPCYALWRVGEWPLYRVDALVRNASSLQKSMLAEEACIKIHPSTAQDLQLEGLATVSQGEIEITLPLIKDARIAPSVLWIANALPETVDLGASFAPITIKRIDR
jgi:NADH-quinone oxidoreductase subunit G